MNWLRTAILLSVMLASPAAGSDVVSTTKVTIRTDFPGGNVTVLENKGNTVYLAPDVRGGKSWFYWQFEATASQPDEVSFCFPNPPKLSALGPAFSHDGGKTWHWYGAHSTRFDAKMSPQRSDFAKGSQEPRMDWFTFHFTKERLTVRLAVAIPYLDENLQAFLEQNKENPHLVRNVLTRTDQGTPVELLTIGEHQPGRPVMLLTARHHACESMASYVVEGFVQEAISDSPFGKQFRERFVLQVVPLVDKDGVQAGDQGKWRHPHDHNRDYGVKPIHPEVQAIQDLAAAQNIAYALDVHCPSIRGDVHEAFYFDGLALPHIKANVDELIGWLKEERPAITNAPLNFLKAPKGDSPEQGLPFSHYFAQGPHSVFAATLEVPYAQKESLPALTKKFYDVPLMRAYGESLLRAWLRTEFVSQDNAEAQLETDYAKLHQVRSIFQKSYRGQTEQLRAEAESELKRPDLAPFAQAEANSRLALIALHQKEYDRAASYCQAAYSNPGASRHQRSAALALRVLVECTNPESTDEQIESSMQALHEMPFAEPGHLSTAIETTGRYYEARKKYSAALRHAYKKFEYIQPYERGRAWLRLAEIYEQMGYSNPANNCRQSARGFLRPRLDTAPKSIFGAMMIADYFEATYGVHDSTVEYRREAAQMVLDHAISSPAMKEKAQRALAELENKSP